MLIAVVMPDICGVFISNEALNRKALSLASLGQEELRRNTRE